MLIRAIFIFSLSFTYCLAQEGAKQTLDDPSQTSPIDSSDTQALWTSFEDQQVIGIKTGLTRVYRDGKNNLFLHIWNVKASGPISKNGTPTTLSNFDRLTNSTVLGGSYLLNWGAVDGGGDIPDRLYGYVFEELKLLEERAKASAGVIKSIRSSAKVFGAFELSEDEKATLRTLIINIGDIAAGNLESWPDFENFTPPDEWAYEDQEKIAKLKKELEELYESWSKFTEKNEFKLNQKILIFQRNGVDPCLQTEVIEKNKTLETQKSANKKMETILAELNNFVRKVELCAHIFNAADTLKLVVNAKLKDAYEREFKRISKIANDSQMVGGEISSEELKLEFVNSDWSISLDEWCSFSHLSKSEKGDIKTHGERMLRKELEPLNQFFLNKYYYQSDPLLDKKFRFVAGTEFKIGRESFNYLLPETLEKQKQEEDNKKTTFFAGWMPQGLNKSYLGLSYTTQRYFKPNSKVEVCNPLDDHEGTQTCVDAIIGAPELKRESLWQLEMRVKLGRYGLAPKVTRNMETDRTGVNIPYYFVTSPKKELVGGLSLDWLSSGKKEGEDSEVRLGFFVGSGFKLGSP